MHDDLPLCGIDEAGRGPLAGPLVMAGVILHRRLHGLMDSKLLSEEKREKLYAKIIDNSAYCIIRFSPEEIDGDGLSRCMRKGLEIIKEKLPDAHYLFDGNTAFGVDGIETMIKADMKVREVSAASILAKVIRDREMIEIAKAYPQYGFEHHKGYGTKAHINAIRKYGRCAIHRQSFRVERIDTPTLF
jgi:ribonuclease HII